MLGAAVAVNFILLVPLFLSGTAFMQYFDTAWLSLFSIGRFSAGAKPMSLDVSMFGEWLAPLGLFVFVCLRRRQLWPFVAWLLCDFAGSIASGDYFAHQFKQLIPSMAVCAGVSLAIIFSGYPAKKPAARRI